MIFMYHKVDIITPTEWWVSVATFRKQISQIKEKYQLVYLDDYVPGSVDQAVITFDDGYENVFNHAFPVLQEMNVPFEIFIIGNRIGDWNDFDSDEPATRFCSLEHLQEMAESGARIQWHTKNHRFLPGLTEDEMRNEMEIEDDLKMAFSGPNLRWLSYPYGKHDERSIRLARHFFGGAVSVSEGTDHDRYRLNRVAVTQNWNV